MSVEVQEPGNPATRWDFPHSVSEGSHHPEWFTGVIRGFLAEVTGLALVDLARQSQRHDGAWVEVLDPPEAADPAR